MNADSSFVLSSLERQQPLWRERLIPMLKDRLAMLQAKLDGDADPTETAKLRGRIAEVKAMLLLNEEAPNVS